MKLNDRVQFYKGVRLQLITRGDYKKVMAKRYTLNGTRQNVWIPNRHLEQDGTIREGENLDYIFVKALRQLELAGYELYFRSTKEENK